MATNLPTVRGMESGPHELIYTPMYLQCPRTQAVELVNKPRINVYANMICVEWECRACVPVDRLFGAKHTAVLPQAVYVSPDAKERTL